MYIIKISKINSIIPIKIKNINLTTNKYTLKSDINIKIKSKNKLVLNITNKT